ncbi:MAG: type IV toxin-antitoxin system AbiEi family antitoxin [Sphingobacterium sp.]
MGTIKGFKINQLLQSQPSGVVFLSSWLVEQGYSHDLLRKYKNSNWFTPIGSGAMVRTGEEVGYEGALYALQEQLGLSVHLGGRTALSLLGRAHYLDFNVKKTFLFCKSGTKLPTWFLDYDWGHKIEQINTSFLPSDIALSPIEQKTFSIKISSPERAILECLYLTPKVHSFLECYELMEGLNNLRPNYIQTLLEQCSSVKVKRLFLYMAEKANHNWFNYIKIEKIDLGSGKRALLNDGVYIPKYNITVPKELET